MAFLKTDTEALGHVLKVMDGGTAAALLVAAAKAKIFDDFKDGPVTVETVATKRRWDSQRAERILNALASLQFLTRTQNANTVEYKLTDSGTYLVSDNKRTIHEYITNLAPMFTSCMRDIIKYLDEDYEVDAGMEDSSGGGDAAFDFGYDEVKMYRNMENFILPGLEPMLKVIDFSSYKTCVDLGGGTCAVGKELIRLYPDMHVTVIEKADVVKAVKENFLTGQEKQLVLKEGDFFKDELPAADLYLISKVMNGWSPEELDTMMKKIFKAVNQGGGLLVLDWCLYESKDGPNTMAHTWDVLLMTHQGQSYSESEYKQIMEKYGFKDFQFYRTSDNFEYDVIFARKP